MVQSTRQLLGRGSAMNANENTMAVWTYEWKVQMMEKPLHSLRRSLLLKDGRLNGHQHSGNNLNC